jgi:hypothetical protein
MHETESFTIAVAAVLPLKCADEAQRMLRAGSVEGRFILVPDAN